MKCPNCANEISVTGTGKFCGFCGYKVTFSAAGQPAPSAQASYEGFDHESSPPRAEPPAFSQSLFVDAFRQTLRWKPLSLVVTGFIAVAAVVILLSLVSSVIAAAIANSSSSSFSSRAEGVAAFAVVSGIVTVLAAYVVGMIFLAATAKMCYELSVSGRQLGRSESLRFAAGNIGTVTVGPVVLFIGAGGVLLGEWLLFLMGQIDFVGPIVTGLAFAPVTVLNIGLFLALYYGIWLMFISMASGVTGIGDVLQTTWSLVRRSFRTLIPELLSLTLIQTLIGMIGGLLLLAGFYLTTSLAFLGGTAGAISRMSSRGMEQLISEMLFGGSRYGGSSAGATAAGLLLGVFAFAIGMTVLIGFIQAFNIVFFLNGCSRIYDRTARRSQSAASVVS